MNILPKLIMALFGVSAVLDIAEKIKNWGGDKKKDEKEEEKKEDEPSRVWLQRNQKQETLLTGL